MEQESAAAAAMAAVNSHEDDRELCTAALQLTTLMYTTPSPETLTTLRLMKRRFLSRRRSPPPPPPQPSPSPFPSAAASNQFSAAAVPAIKFSPSPAPAPSTSPVPAISETQIKRFMLDQPPRPPIRRLESLIGECTPPEVKQLTESDIKDSQARLSLPKPYGRESIKPLLNPGEDVEKGVPVTAYDADGNEFEMKLKLWANRKVYVLTSGWKPFAKAHGLRHLEDFVTVWVFRKLDTGNLCVAITSRRLPVYWALKRIRPPSGSSLD